jgi:AmiR/NasT family two-component response regulator
VGCVADAIDRASAYQPELVMIDVTPGFDEKVSSDIRQFFETPEKPCALWTSEFSRPGQLERTSFGNIRAIVSKPFSLMDMAAVVRAELDQVMKNR